MLNIDEIQNGIVIDHIKAGTAVGLMELLGITGNKTANVALIQNARSHKADCGRKDIIKVEGDASWLNLEVLAYLDPDISVTVIENGNARFRAGAAMLHTVLLPARSQTKKARQSSLWQHRPASHSHIRCRAGAVHSEGLYLQQSPKIAIQSFVRLFIRKDVPAHAHTPAFPDVPSSVGRKPYSGEALLPLT